MVGDSAGEIYEWDGKSWSPPTTVDPRNDLPFVVGLSCPTTKECVAATFDGYAYTWDGASWSSPTLLDSTPGQGDITSLAQRAMPGT